jgi:hypothetical protein
MLETLLAMSLQLSLMQRQLDEYVAQQNSSVEVALADLPPVLQKVAQCESGARQHDANGKVVTNPKTHDYGLFQINRIHLPTAKKRGMDIMTEQGNIQFAMYLYNRNGLKDWSASKSCWQS